MKPIHLLIAAVVVVGIALFVMQDADGPAENAGAAIDEAVNDAARTVEDVAD